MKKPETWGQGEAERLRIAALEDDIDQSEIVALWLKDAGFSVKSFADASGFLKAIRRDSFDMYLLDWILPSMSGIEVLQKLRKELRDETPVIITTVKDKERSIVRALESGADDYLVKPMGRAELIARVAAVLRRTGASTTPDTILRMSPYVLDISKQCIFLDEREIVLTNREFGLAYLLFKNAGKLLSRGHILESIWGVDDNSLTTRTVDTHVSRLRKKLQLNLENGWKLTAVYQHGYRLEDVSSDNK